MTNLSRAVVLLFSLVIGPLPRADAGGFPDVVTQIKRSVVGIAVYNPSGRPQSRLLGTGFAVGDGHYVATNNHVVDTTLNLEKNERLVVVTGTGTAVTAHGARLLVSKPQQDLALLKIDTALPPLLFDAMEVREGEIYAFTGFPIGAVLGLYPVTHRGMVSSVTPIAIPASASGQLSAEKIARLRNPMMVYQLDATAYPGNSGSPLYNMETGAVVGILNQVYVKSTKEDVLSNPSGISYAIPIRHLRDLLRQQMSDR